MSESDPALPRRAILKSAGLGVGAGLLSGLPIGAQTAGGGMIWSAECWANKGDVPLYIYRKRLGAPKTGEPPRPVLFLVHGSSVTWRIFDLDTPGHGEYSMMNVFARWGFDVWTMDHDGYGYSGSSGNNSDIASSVEDLKAAIPVVARETGLRVALGADLGSAHKKGDVLRFQRFPRFESAIGASTDSSDELGQFLRHDELSEVFVGDAADRLQILVIEEVTERPVADVVHETGDAQEFLYEVERRATIEGLPQTGVQTVCEAAGHVHGAHGMLKAAVLGGGKDPEAGLKLVHAAKTLHPRAVNEVLLRAFLVLACDGHGEMDVAVNGVG